MRGKIAILPLFVLLSLFSQNAHAGVFASVQGVVHDPTHRPVAGAQVTLKAANSGFALHATTGQDGSFLIEQAPIGVYTLTAVAEGFAPVSENVALSSATHPVFHLMLAIGKTQETVAVHESEFGLSQDTVTPTTLVSRSDIEETPGAGRTLGMEMITDYVPGSYMTHDMLHMRGGHQTSWLIDGIAIPNTKIASNVGPQIDPKDIDALETQRGSYASEVGDRTYGVFNVLPRNGFERDHAGEFLLTGGNLGSGEAQLSFGDHTEKTAWYTSLTGSRSNYGLATPVAQIYHDATNSESGFVNLLRNQTEKDQLRVDGQYRQDHFDVPYDPNQNDWEQGSNYYESWGLRDAQTERDGFVIANWVHTISPTALFEVAPFYHYNQANYDSLATDFPAATTWHQSSNYVGGQGDLRFALARNNFSAGGYAFYQSENDLFGVIINDGSAQSIPNTAAHARAALGEFYFSDQLRVDKWITLLGGMRYSNYSAGVSESAFYPRIGATVLIPRLGWVLRGFYGHFFQPAPVETVSSAVLDYAGGLPTGQNTFTPLPSERDEEHQFGLEIPYKGWVLDVTNFKNRVNNYLDHANLGESNLYFPIAVDGALVRAWEMTVRSPRLAHVGQFHLTYSNQIAEQRGNIIGGFTCALPNDPACALGPNYFPMDHDQRNTLNTGFTATLPKNSWFSTNVYYGSGFTNGLAGSGVGPYQGNYLPAHTTFDVAGGHGFGERFNLTGSILNVTNHRVLLDNSVTIGGFHWNDPRIFMLSARYRFKF